MKLNSTALLVHCDSYALTQTVPMQGINWMYAYHDNMVSHHTMVSEAMTRIEAYSARPMFWQSRSEWRRNWCRPPHSLLYWGRSQTWERDWERDWEWDRTTAVRAIARQGWLAAQALLVSTVDWVTQLSLISLSECSSVLFVILCARYDSLLDLVKCQPWMTRPDQEPDRDVLS